MTTSIRAFLRRARRRSLHTALLLGAGAPALRAQPPADPFPAGKSVLEADIHGTPLQLFVYRPASYTGDGFILLLHGASRAAEAYRDNAVGMAEKHKRLVVVPFFDLKRFPEWRYQFGGVYRTDSTFARPDERTYAFIPALAAFIRRREGNPSLPWILAGFSAGGQFVSRMAAFLDLDAERLVAMASGSTMFPTRAMDFGLGFGKLPDELSNDERLRRYLALPMTVYIGTADVEMAQLPQGDAYAQGVHRYSRNIRWFNEAMDLAHTRQWAFNWRLVIADGPGHSPKDMFDHPQVTNALFGHRTP
ncbi:MAG TPA: hypothetical protein VFV33_16645 [Gemmatimonadaceae bacterium]|nr:hypothetical protein [Gemmatimonadaceae bacterium]